MPGGFDDLLEQEVNQKFQQMNEAAGVTPVSAETTAPVNRYNLGNATPQAPRPYNERPSVVSGKKNKWDALLEYEGSDPIAIGGKAVVSTIKPIRDWFSNYVKTWQRDYPPAVADPQDLFGGETYSDNRVLNDLARAAMVTIPGVPYVAEKYGKLALEHYGKGLQRKSDIADYRFKRRMPIEQPTKFLENLKTKEDRPLLSISRVIDNMRKPEAQREQKIKKIMNEKEKEWQNFAK